MYEKRHIQCRDKGHVFTDGLDVEWRSGDIGFRNDGSLVQLVHWCDMDLSSWVWERMSDEYLDYATDVLVQAYKP